MQRNARLLREMDKIQSAPPTGISMNFKNSNLNLIEAQILGPPASPYENSVFNLEIMVPEQYPFVPPSVRFMTKVYHPNIDSEGRICMDILKMPPNGAWKPTVAIENLLVAIQMLLQSPNPSDPLMPEIALEFLHNRVEFERKAVEYCQMYAK